jgi:hypothetical protein
VLLAVNSDHITQPWLHAGLFVWISLSYVLCGLVAWWRRPASRLGPLDGRGGLRRRAVEPGLVERSRRPVDRVDIRSDAAGAVHARVPGVPDGRLRTRLDRSWSGSGYVTAIARPDLRHGDGRFGADNPFTLVQWSGFATWAYHAMLVILSAHGARRARRPRDPATQPGPAPPPPGDLLIDAFALGLGMTAVLLMWGMFAWPGFIVVQRLTLLVLGLAPVAFLIGLLDTHLGRAGAGNLFVRLRENPGDLRDGARRDAARPVADPAVLAAAVRHLGRRGRPARRAAGRQATANGAATVIEHDGAPLAALVHDPSLREEPALLDAVTAAAAIALENGRLQAELRAHVEELRGSRARVLEAGQRERQRLERNLHDGAQQRLIALSLDLGLLESRLGTDPDARARRWRRRSRRSRSRSTSCATSPAACTRPSSVDTGSRSRSSRSSPGRRSRSG